MKATLENYYLYNHKLAKRARKLRTSMTKAECILWRETLSARKTGCQFRRQRPIGPYIVDFVCLPIRLVIEVDGASHEIEGADHRDKARDEFLRSVGFLVVRFDDEDILFKYQDITFYLREKISQRLEDMNS